MKRPHTSSPPSVSQRCREDFKLLESEDEFSSPSPSSENLREAFLLSAPLSLSLDPASPKKDALLSPLILNLTPSPLTRFLEVQEQDEYTVHKGNKIKEDKESKDPLEESKNSEVEDFEEDVVVDS